jgi:glycerophosphoryl diester phosphodiesterase
MTARADLPAGLRRIPIAHRALHDAAAGRPENSPAAFAAAIAAGYAIECDVQLSRDGQAMVFHDEVLDRLTATSGPLAARTAAELGRLPLRSGTDTIPTLPQMLALVAGRVPLLIEIKDQTGTMGPTDGRLEAAVAAALRDYEGEVAVMSFNPHAVAAMARLAPGLPLGLTTSAYDPADWAPLPPATCDHLRAIPDAATLPVSFISHEAADLSRPRVAALKAQGLAVLCWTITSAVQEAAARRIACNITFEGYPARLDLGPA